MISEETDNIIKKILKSIFSNCQEVQGRYFDFDYVDSSRATDCKRLKKNNATIALNVFSNKKNK